MHVLLAFASGRHVSRSMEGTLLTSNVCIVGRFAGGEPVLCVPVHAAGGAEGGPAAGGPGVQLRLRGRRRPDSAPRQPAGARHLTVSEP